MSIRPRSKSEWVCSGELVEALLQIMEQGPQLMRNLRPSKFGSIHVCYVLFQTIIYLCAKRPRSKSEWVCSGELVEALLQIMEQGPQPMRNLRPSKKTPNGADHFTADHQTEYETYEAQGGSDRARQVDAHNAACPKMRDELERRRSTARATTQVVVAKHSKATNQMYFDPNCHACQKMRKAEEAKKKNPKPKPRTDRKRKPDRKSRITKPKRTQRKTRSTFKLARLRTNKGCQYYYQYTNKGTSPALILKGAETGMTEEEMAKSEIIYFSNRNRKSNTNSQAAMSNPSMSQNGSKSNVISQNPDTSANSISSYNSNMSLDHEPMVSN